MAGAVVAMLVFGAVLGVASYVLVSRLAYSSLDQVVDTRLAEVSSQLHDAKKGTLDLEAVEVSSPVVVRVVSADGTLLAETPGSASAGDICSRPSGYLTKVEPTDSPDGPVTVCAAASLKPVERVQDGVLTALLIFLPLVVIGVAIAVWLAVGRALGSVERLREQAQQMTSVDDGALAVEPTGDEIERLGTTLNNLLARLHAQSRTTRRFVADAGHELRNPLATLRVALEFDAEGQGPNTYALALGELDRLEALVQDLLALARADSREGPAWERIELADVVNASLRSQETLHPGLRFEADLASCAIMGDSRAIRGAVDNLIANAGRHAGEAVNVRLSATRESIAITVDDDGAGLAPQDCERVFDRFVRLDEARDRDEGGSGLGLAIVAAVAQAHGGSVSASPGPGGHFTMNLIPCE